MTARTPSGTGNGRRPSPPSPRPPDAEIVWLKDYLPYRMAVVAAHLLRESARVYKRHRDSITTPQFRTIWILANFEPLTAAEISRISRLDKVSIGRALAALQRRGFVRRRRIRADRRALEVTVTREGWNYYRALAPKLRRREFAMRGVIGADELVRLFAILDRFDAAFEDLNGRRRRYGDAIEIEDALHLARGNGNGRRRAA